MAEWRPIPGYRLYEVSDEGEVRSAKGRILAGWVNRHGYRMVCLCKGGQRKNFGVHQLVLKAFRRKTAFSLQGCHNDGVKLNNHLSNLRWGTVRSNARDKIRHGTIRQGEKAPNSRFTDGQVLAIRARYKAGEAISPMAKEHGVNYYTIAHIVHRKTWKHI